MALIDSIQFTSRIADQAAEEQNAAQTPNAGTRAAPGAAAATEDDRFTRTTETENEAGLFGPPSFQVVAAAIQAAQERGTTGNRSDAAGVAGQAQTESSAIPASTGDNTVVAAGASGVTSSVAQAADENVQVELQELNTALVTLGLTQSEIAVVDRVAQLIQNFNPLAFTDLVNQFQNLSQAAQSGTTPANTASFTSSGNSSASQTTTKNSAIGRSAFALQEISIRFAGVNSGAQASEFSLQVQEVNVTLGNTATGQATQVQAPKQGQVPAIVTPKAAFATA